MPSDAQLDGIAAATPDNGSAREQDNLQGLLVVGDIHGQLASLHSVLDIVDKVVIAPVGRSAVVFLGDYVDRGKNSVEVVLLLLLDRLAYPQHVFLLRRNHESYRSFDWGFNEELHTKLRVDLPPARV
jgi:predicted MPP superfamily phosphohydrolase